MTLFILHPLITALLLLYVNHEARALRQKAPTHRRLSFIIVSGMVLVLLGGLLFDLPFLLGSTQPAIFSPVIWGAVGGSVIVAICTLFQSRNSMKGRPKEASPYDVGSSQEMGGFGSDIWVARLYSLVVLSC